jgi:hypothetical protein
LRGHFLNSEPYLEICLRRPGGRGGLRGHFPNSKCPTWKLVCGGREAWEA